LISRAADIQNAYDAAVREAENVDKKLMEFEESGDFNKSIEQDHEFNERFRKAIQGYGELNESKEDLQREYSKISDLFEEHKV
jgi:hypothetical protein